MDSTPQARRLALRRLRALHQEIGKYSGAGLPYEMGQQVRRVVETVSDVVRPFSDRELGRYGEGGRYYALHTVSAYVADSIAVLEIDTESRDEFSPVTSPPDLSCMTDPSLRAIVERDFEEILSAHATRSWKSAIVLTGGCIEGILLDFVLAAGSAPLEAVSAPSKRDPVRWDLAELVAVCEELGLISEGLVTLSGAVREYRNLIHPGRALRQHIPYDQEEAVIALNTLKALVRDMNA